MGSMASLNLNALLPSGHFESNDHFQQMLNIDSALEALSMSKTNLKLKLQALVAAERFRMPSFPSPGDWERMESFFAHYRHHDSQSMSAQGVAEYDTIQQSLADIAILLKTFEELQVAVRHRFELRARSLRQGKTGIMDLPDEVLRMIFETFRLPVDFPIFPPDSGENKDDPTTIKNIRLTCLRFRQNSSHLLVRCLTVSPGVSSLDHLERVLSHPEISRGERVLRIDLRYYSAAIAADFQNFSIMCYEKLARGSAHVRWWAQQEESTLRRLLPKEVSLESAKVSITGVRHILSLWEPFRNGAPIEESDHLDAAALALRKGHERYRELFQQQNKILQDGYFARTVAAAASKSKVWLSMSDAAISPGNYPTKFGREEFGGVDFMLIANPYRLQYDVSPMIQPQQCWHAGGDTIRDAPQSLLYEIPLAMHTAEVHLAGLEVQLHYPHDMNLQMSKEQLSGLAEATKDLKTFRFCMSKYCGHRGVDPLPQPEDLESFYAYLRATMGPRMVPHLYLDLANKFGHPDGMRFPIKPLLCSLNWHGLKSAELEHFDVSLEDLRLLMDMLEPGTRLAVQEFHMRSGTWAAALDCLRSKVSRDSFLAYPRGAECDLMTDDEYDDIFDIKPGYFEIPEDSDATLYMTSVEGVENPLRKYGEVTEASMEL